MECKQVEGNVMWITNRWKQCHVEYKQVESNVMWTADSLKAVSHELLLWSSMQHKIRGYVVESCEKVVLEDKCKSC